MNKIILPLLLLFLSSCKKDKPADKEPEEEVIVDTQGVYIINEGNFNFGNASVSYFSPADSSVTEDLYKSKNGKNLGDVCQSLCFFQEKGYLVVNNSQKIEVLRKSDFVAQATISGFTSPRYFLPINSNKAYVSDLYAGKIAVVNLSENKISSYITCPTWSEEMAEEKGIVLITRPHSEYVYFIDVTTDGLLDSLNVGYGSNSVQKDKNGFFWVLSGGSVEKDIPGTLSKINPLTRKIETSFSFPNASSSPWKLKINGALDTLYFLNDGVFRLSISDMALPSDAFIKEETRNFYGLGIHPKNGDVYVSDALNYTQKSSIYRFQSKGTLLYHFKAGLISSDFVF